MQISGCPVQISWNCYKTALCLCDILTLESKLEFTDMLHPYLVELHIAGSIRGKDVNDFMLHYFLTSLVHAIVYCIFMLLLPLSAPALVIYLLTKRALKNKIRD